MRPDIAQGLPAANLVDVCALGVIALGALRGFFRGLAGEAARALAPAAGLALGWAAGRPLAAWMLEHTRLTGERVRAAAFLTAVLGAVVALVAARFVLGKLFKVVVNERVNRVGGALAGAARGALIIAIVFVTLNLWPNEALNRRFGEDSLLGSALLRIWPGLREAGAGEVIPEPDVPAGEDKAE
jgi:hypothetical protein